MFLKSDVYIIYETKKNKEQVKLALCGVHSAECKNLWKVSFLVKTIVFILGLVMSASSSAPTTNIPHPVVIGYEAANAPPTNICTGLQSSFISVEQVCMYV